MAELVVLVFDNEEGALQARDRLLEIQKHRMLQLADAAVVVRRQDGKVKIKQLHGLVGPGYILDLEVPSEVPSSED